MNFQNGPTRFFTGALAAVFLWTMVPLPAAQAAVVGTDATVAVAEQEQVKERLDALLSRQDVRDQLVEMGIDPAEARARVDALTPAEARQLAGRLDEMPAASGDIVGALLFIFVLLLVTDLLGLTDVYPFTR